MRFSGTIVLKYLYNEFEAYLYRSLLHQEERHKVARQLGSPPSCAANAVKHSYLSEVAVFRDWNRDDAKGRSMNGRMEPTKIFDRFDMPFQETGKEK